MTAASTKRVQVGKEAQMYRNLLPKVWRKSLISGVGAVVLCGCQQTTIDSSGAEVQVEEPTAEVELASSFENATEAAAAAVPAPAPAPTPAVVAGPARHVPVPARPAPAAAVPDLAAASPPVATLAPSPVAPRIVTVPARTILPVELDKTLSSHTSQVGERFRGLLIQDVAVDGRVVFPRGTIVTGQVTEAKPAKKVGGRARLSLEFYALELPDGRQVSLSAVFAEVGQSQTGKDAAIIGGSTLGGAVIGRAVDKGEGTAIGAVVGGLAGAAVANETRAKAVVVNAGTVLTLETTQPISVEVQG